MFTDTLRPDNATDREIILTRLIDAPRDLVFGAWLTPERVNRWWGPNGFTTTTLEMDVRPGGIWRFIMHGPDGTDYDNRIVYSEVVPNERLVYAHGRDIDDDPTLFHVTVTFSEEDGKTRITMRSLFVSAEERRRVEGFGAIELGNQTLASLEAFVAEGA